MAKPKKMYVCSECGHESPKWVGQCARCDQWNTMEERAIVPEVPKTKPSLSVDNTPPSRLKDIECSAEDRFASGISEVDRVLGGGIVRDSLVIFSAEPGMGKSTILTQIGNNVANAGMKVLYVSGEESERQVKARAERLLGEDISDNFWLKSENSMNRIKEYVAAIDPDFVVIDSIQTVYLEEHLPSRAGGAAQVMACTDELMAMAKRDRRAVFVVGQVTKNDELAGVRALEHAVDAVIYMEGDRSQQLRIMRAIKNRYGTTDEIGLFQMEEHGLVAIDNTADLFMTHRDRAAIGCALTVSLEGNRPLVIEIESLACNSAYAVPIRTAEGINKQQLQVLSAILEKRAGISLGNKDVYVKVSGGVRVSETAVNLGILMAIASSCKDAEIPPGYLYIGEVGLTGELKSVPQMGKRLKEAERIGFTKVFVPKGNLRGVGSLGKLEVIEAADIKEVVNKTFKKA